MNALKRGTKWKGKPSQGASSGGELLLGCGRARHTKPKKLTVHWLVFCSLIVLNYCNIAVMLRFANWTLRANIIFFPPLPTHFPLPLRFLARFRASARRAHVTSHLP